MEIVTKCEEIQKHFEKNCMKSDKMFKCMNMMNSILQLLKNP